MRPGRICSIPGDAGNIGGLTSKEMIKIMIIVTKIIKTMH